MTLVSRVGIGLYPPDARSALELVTRAEAAGVGTFWAVMSPIDRDTPTILAAASVSTTSIRLGTAVVPAFTRHPLALATQALALEDLAPGRIRLGIGASHQITMLPAYGISSERPLEQLREYVQVLRPALQQGAFSINGKFYSGEATLLSTPGTPVLLSALGEKAFQLAGEIADGVISWICPPNYLMSVALPAMQRGASLVSRPVPPLIAHTMVAPDTYPARVRTMAREFLTYYQLRPFYRRMLSSAGFDVTHQISDELIDALVIHGDDRAIINGLQERLGIFDELVVTVLHGDDQWAAEERFFDAVRSL